MRITGRTKVCCLIGNPVEHSMSPAMHNAGFMELGLDFVYVTFRVEDVEKAINDGMRALGIHGMNVTIPHKVAAMEHVDGLTKEARLIGAVNTIFRKGGKLVGHNTDGIGNTRALREAGVEVREAKVVVLGAGGAARAVACQMVLEKAGEVMILNRTVDRAKELAKRVGARAGGLDGLEEELSDADVLVDCTSLGMRGKAEGETLVTAEMMRPDLAVNDIVYNPRNTRLLQEARKANCRAVVPGDGMLLHQGTEAFEIWTGRKAPVEIMRRALLNELEGKAKED
jgi:shikimate dehydrogenase